MNSLALVNEKDILLRMQQGDERAFKLLYNHYSKFSYRNFLKLVKIPDTAAELTQTLFVKVWNKRDLLDTEADFVPYLLRMASNLVHDFYRKASRDNRLQDEIIAFSTELYSHVEEDIFYKQSKAEIDLAISQLPPQQKLVFTLCKLDGKSHEEVSKMLDISTSTVNNHIVTATKKLRQIILGNPSAATILMSFIWLF
jgi:RNA polymerase sigma-70 factor (family 1)